MRSGRPVGMPKPLSCRVSRLSLIAGGQLRSSAMRWQGRGRGEVEARSKGQRQRSKSCRFWVEATPLGGGGAGMGVDSGRLHCSTFRSCRGRVGCFCCEARCDAASFQVAAASKPKPKRNWNPRKSGLRFLPRLPGCLPCPALPAHLHARTHILLETSSACYLPLPTYLT